MKELEIKKPNDDFTGVAFSPDGYLVLPYFGGNIGIWDIETGEEIRVLKGHADKVSALAFSFDGRLASASKDKTVILWNSATGETLEIFAQGGSVHAVDFSPDGLLA